MWISIKGSVKKTATYFEKQDKNYKSLGSSKYCWIRNGAVHNRQSENRAAIPLQSIEDLDQ